MIVIKVQGNASLQHSKLQMGGLGDGLCFCTQKNPSVSKHSRLRGFIHEECFDTHIRKSVRWLRSSVRQNVGLQNQMSEVQILSGSPKNLGCWYSWEHSGFASLNPRFDPGTVHQIGEREALVTSGDCKSSTLRYTGFESLALHQITVDTQRC